jgi:hypothetical protein
LQRERLCKLTPLTAESEALSVCQCQRFVNPALIFNSGTKGLGFFGFERLANQTRDSTTRSNVQTSSVANPPRFCQICATELNMCNKNKNSEKTMLSFLYIFLQVASRLAEHLYFASRIDLCVVCTLW